jgi:hypothetical protein
MAGCRIRPAAMTHKRMTLLRSHLVLASCLPGSCHGPAFKTNDRKIENEGAGEWGGRRMKDLLRRIIPRHPKAPLDQCPAFEPNRIGHDQGNALADQSMPISRISRGTSSAAQSARTR